MVCLAYPLCVCVLGSLSMCTFVGYLPPVRLLSASRWRRGKGGSNGSAAGSNPYGITRKRVGLPFGYPIGQGRDKPLIWHRIYY